MPSKFLGCFGVGGGTIQKIVHHFDLAYLPTSDVYVMCFVCTSVRRALPSRGRQKLAQESGVVNEGVSEDLQYFGREIENIEET